MKKQRMTRRFLATILAVLMLLPTLGCPAFAAEATPKSGADYPIVLIHGLFGWGEEDGISNLLPYWGLSSGNFSARMIQQGFTIYGASVGPVSSAHDRCCELFAQLTGTRVDYGQAHADRVAAEYAAAGSSLRHDRYGRDYTGNRKIDGWGPIYDAASKVTGWYDSKINLVGHSFGGPTAVEFTDLLAHGDADEIAWGKAQAAQYGGDWHDYISPLFWGDYRGQYLVNSITSIAGVLNGTTFITANDDLMALARPLVSLLANLTDKVGMQPLYDFQLEQFGVTRLPGASLEDSICALKALGFADGTDNAFYDLTTAGTNQLKKGWETFDNIYYFSYACDKSYRAGGADLPDPDMLAVLLPFSAVMGAYHAPGELVYNVDGSLYGGIDREWQMNDGMVNTISSRYPFGTAHKAYDVNAIESGVWNVHPDVKEDHFSIIGGFFGPQPVTTRNFFDGLTADIRQTVPVFDQSKVSTDAQARKLATPVITGARRTLLRNAALDWKSVSPSCYYEIYRSTSLNGTYRRIDTTLLTAYTDLSAAPLRTYYYKIVAVPFSAASVSSDYSAPVSVKT